MLYTLPVSQIYSNFMKIAHLFGYLISESWLSKWRGEMRGSIAESLLYFQVLALWRLQQLRKQLGQTSSELRSVESQLLISHIWSQASAALTLTELDRLGWVRWLTLNNRRQSIGPKPDSMPRLEWARYKCLTSCSCLLTPPHPSVTHTLGHIINQTPPLLG